MLVVGCTNSLITARRKRKKKGLGHFFAHWVASLINQSKNFSLNNSSAQLYPNPFQLQQVLVLSLDTNYQQHVVKPGLEKDTDLIKRLDSPHPTHTTALPPPFSSPSPSLSPFLPLSLSSSPLHRRHHGGQTYSVCKVAVANGATCKLSREWSSLMPPVQYRYRE